MNMVWSLGPADEKEVESQYIPTYSIRFLQDECRYDVQKLLLFGSSDLVV
jgi:hypothetical protein